MKVWGQDSHWVCWRHSEGCFTSDGFFEKCLGDGGVYSDGKFCVLLWGSFEMLTFNSVLEAIMGVKKSASWAKLDDGEMLGDES